MVIKQKQMPHWVNETLRVWVQYFALGLTTALVAPVTLLFYEVMLDKEAFGGERIVSLKPIIDSLTGSTAQEVAIFLVLWGILISITLISLYYVVFMSIWTYLDRKLTAYRKP
jgi:hypothetical protein